MMNHVLPRAAVTALLVAAMGTPLNAQTQEEYDRQIEQLMNHPAVRNALDHIVETDDQTMDDLVTLTQIPAPPFMEEERAAAFIGSTGSMAAPRARLGLTRRFYSLGRRYRADHSPWRMDLEACMCPD